MTNLFSLSDCYIFTRNGSIFYLYIIIVNKDKDMPLIFISLGQSREVGCAW